MDNNLGLNIDATNRVNQMEKVQKEGLELFKKKNADYGDAFANYGPIGVLIRMGDKISRLQSITNTNRRKHTKRKRHTKKRISGR